MTPESFTVSEFKEDTNFVGLRQTLNTMLGWEPSYAVNGHSPGNSLEAMHDNAVLYNDLYDIVFDETERAIAEGGVGAVFSLIFTLPGEVTLDRARTGYCKAVDPRNPPCCEKLEGLDQGV